MNSPLIHAAFGSQMLAELRKPADRRQRGSAVNFSKPAFNCTHRGFV